MKYFLFSEFFKSVAFAILFGAGYGCVYKAAHSIFFFLRSLFLLIPKVIVALPSFSLKNVGGKYTPISEKRGGAVFANVLDFFAVLIFGLCTILLYYALLDGIFRVYFLIVLLFSFKLSKDFLGKYFAYLLEIIYLRVYKILYVIISLSLLPVRLLAKPFCALILRTYAPIDRKIKKFKERRVLKKKISQIKGIMEKI